MENVDIVSVVKEEHPFNSSSVCLCRVLSYKVFVTRISSAAWKEETHNLPSVSEDFNILMQCPTESFLTFNLNCCLEVYVKDSPPRPSWSME